MKEIQYGSIELTDEDRNHPSTSTRVGGRKVR
jgi:hypothetical protein